MKKHTMGRVPHHSIPIEDIQVGLISPGVLRNEGTFAATQVGMLTLFAGELYAWFVVGEIVGRGGSLVDYEV